MKRRTALKLAATSVVGGVLGTSSTAVLTRLGHERPSRAYEFFTDAEGALLFEICEQLIPRDDTPGATETGAVS